jgi:GNAT superfamily N-acetyltransferase
VPTSEIDLEFYDDPAQFLAETRDFLATDPVIGSVIATVTRQAVARSARGESARSPYAWWVVVREGTTIVSAGMRTAPFDPYPTFVMPMPESAALDLARTLHGRGEALGGSNGALPAAQVIAEETARLTGGRAVVNQHTRLFECTEVTVPEPAMNWRLRVAEARDADLCLDWYTRFGAEADEQARREAGTGHAEHHSLVDILQRIEDGVIWLVEDTDHDCVVHLTGVSTPAYGVSRVGPVYTPPQHRGHGLASYAVGELTRRGLTEGIRMCLFTDQANPTSNKIYEALGYERVVDMANLHVHEART